jgi:hypothetical protein
VTAPTLLFLSGVFERGGQISSTIILHQQYFLALPVGKRSFHCSILEKIRFHRRHIGIQPVITEKKGKRPTASSGLNSSKVVIHSRQTRILVSTCKACHRSAIRGS